jgi:hypothetical protein
MHDKAQRQYSLDYRTSIFFVTFCDEADVDMFDKNMSFGSCALIMTWGITFIALRTLFTFHLLHANAFESNWMGFTLSHHTKTRPCCDCVVPVNQTAFTRFFLAL